MSKNFWDKRENIKTKPSVALRTRICTIRCLRSLVLFIVISSS